MSSTPTQFLLYRQAESEIAGGGGAGEVEETDHADLGSLDYAHAGHTGFQPAGDYLLPGDPISDLYNDALYIAAESDPVFTAWLAAPTYSGHAGLGTGQRVSLSLVDGGTIEGYLRSGGITSD